MTLDRRSGNIRNDGAFSKSNSWRAVGSAETANGRSIIVFQLTEELCGIDDSNGSIVWRYAGTTPYRVAGGLIALRHTGDGPSTLLNAATGEAVDRTTPAGRHAISSAVVAAGSPLMQGADDAREAGWTPKHTPMIGDTSLPLYRYDTDAAYPFPYPMHNEQNARPLGVVGDRAFWFVTGDTGTPGTGGNPDFLIVSNEVGKALWPDLPPYVNFVPVAGSETIFLTVGDYNLTGRRLSDGRAIWKHKRVENVNVAADTTGVFVAYFHFHPETDVPLNVRLECLDTKTGRIRKTWPMTGSSEWLGIAGDDLIVVDNLGIVRIYSCKTLLARRGIL